MGCQGLPVAAGRNIISGRGEGSGRHATGRPISVLPSGKYALEEAGNGQQVASRLSERCLAPGLLTFVPSFWG